MMLLAAVIAAGCAGQPSSPPHAPAAAVPPLGVAQSSDAAAPADIEAQRLAAAKKRKLKLVNKDGQELFCQPYTPTGSKIPREPICLTAEQLDKLEHQQQLDFDRFYLRPAIPSTGH